MKKAMNSETRDLMRLLYRRATRKELSSDELGKLEKNVNNLLEALSEVDLEPPVTFVPKKNLD